MSHSPGPWNIDKYQSGEIYDKHSRLIATVNHRIAQQQLPYQDNAKLIAAAPALLEACLTAFMLSKQQDREDMDVLEYAIIQAGVNLHETVFE